MRTSAIQPQNLVAFDVHVHLEAPVDGSAADLAGSLQRVADGGARELYEGDLAKKLVEGVRGAGGILSFRDLREYKPQWRSPLKLHFGAYDIFTVAPPSGGGLVMGATLGLNPLVVLVVTIGAGALFGMAGLTLAEADRLLLAYEPVWAMC